MMIGSLRSSHHVKKRLKRPQKRRFLIGATGCVGCCKQVSLPGALNVVENSNGPTRRTGKLLADRQWSWSRRLRRRRPRAVGLINYNSIGQDNENTITNKASLALVRLSCPAGGCSRKFAKHRRSTTSQLLSLTVMCLIIISDFQQQIGDHLNAQRGEGGRGGVVNRFLPEQSAQSKLLIAPATTTTTTTSVARPSSYHHGAEERGDKQTLHASAQSDERELEELWPSRETSGLFRMFLFAEANSDANRLYEDLMMTYNRIVRPVQNSSDRLVVSLSLKLSQLIDVNLKNQMMTTNVWLNQEWSDYKLKWDPSEYGGIEDINLPAEQIWLPDIVLYNSAEGYFAVSIMTKAKVRFDGHVTWNPPAIFRSSCQIDITYFPFDSQNCHLKFGSWTFGTKIDLRHINDTDSIIERGTDLSEYYQNVEWDIMQASAKRNVITYICCPNDFYGDVTFNFKLRRKPLFYTVNLILPCVGITILSFLVFYLPSDSGEKVTLTISILVSLIFFLSVLIETIPSTSLAMPLLGKYLAFTMVLITVSVCATVCVLNIHFRTPSTHSMPSWVKRWCIEILPKYIFMTVPQCQSQQASTILPEQLIYPHNLAYVAQQQADAAASAKQKANSTKAKHRLTSSKVSQVTDKGAPSENGQTKGAKSIATPSGRVSQVHQQQRQQQQVAANSLQLDPAALADWSRSSKPNKSSPSSLFLPYLQSEAARRLQLQRSRSSERDSSSNNNNNQNNCDTRQQEQHEWTRQTVIAVDMQQEEQERRRQLDTVADQQKPAGSGSAPKVMEQRESIANNNTSSGGLLTRLFNRKSSLKGPKASRKTAHFAGAEQLERTDDRRRSASIQQDSSSSLENDYQHHNHFQARASVCSTNLWRIGPTRRCSLAVPPDYPAYYRPLAHLSQQQQHSHPHPHPHADQHRNQISTLSGCIQTGGHYHLANSHQMASSESSSSAAPPRAVNALVSAAATNLIVRPKKGARESKLIPRQTMAPSIGGHLANSQQQSNQSLLIPGRNCYTGNLVAAQNDHQANGTSPLPTPPPPLPPANPLNLHDLAELNEQVCLRAANQPQQQQYQRPFGQRGPGIRQTDTPSRAANMMMPGISGSQSMVLDPSRLLVSGAGADGRATLLLTTGRGPNVRPDYQAQQSATNRSLPPTSGQMNKNATCNLDTSAPQSSFNRSQLLALQSGHSNSNIHLQCAGQMQPVQAGSQLISRSRSTDHRLCMYANDNGQLYLANSELQQQQQQPIMTGSQLYRHQQSSLESAQLPPPPPSQGGLAAANQQGYLLSHHSPAQSVGRVLGQAYMQRLQRQPTIYSLSSSAQRPSRSIQRGTTYFVPLELGQQRQVRCNSVLDTIRRSRSQTSLDKRLLKPKLQLNVTGFNQCNHCQPGSSSHRSRAGQQGQCSNGGQACPCNASEPTTGCRNSMPVRQDARECCGRMASTQRDQHCGQHRVDLDTGRTVKSADHSNKLLPPPMTSLDLMKLTNEVDKAIQNAMFIAQHIDNLDEFESVKENWKYIAMVIDRIFLIVFLFVGIFGTVAIFAMVPWSYYTTEKPIDLQLTRLLALNLTGDEPDSRSCQDL